MVTSVSWTITTLDEVGRLESLASFVLLVVVLLPDELDVVVVVVSVLVSLVSLEYLESLLSSQIFVGCFSSFVGVLGVAWEGFVSAAAGTEVFKGVVETGVGFVVVVEVVVLLLVVVGSIDVLVVVAVSLIVGVLLQAPELEVTAAVPVASLVTSGVAVLLGDAVAAPVAEALALLGVLPALPSLPLASLDFLLGVFCSSS